MSRNKYPEETVQKILEVSCRLFQEKGYDHTTVQDIVDVLGMSKGTIYHHFKSKEDILDKINDMYYSAVNWFEDVRLDPGLTGLQKLREILIRQFTDARKHTIDHIQVSLEKNPRILALALNSTIYDAAPFFQQMVEEGVRDGSIATAWPKEFSEAVMVLFNLWVGLFSADREDFQRKVDFLQALTAGMGVPLIDEALRRAALEYYDKVMALAGRK